MNIFNKVTLQSLRKNRIRTIVTIIGIMLSTALICAVTTSFASVRQYAINYFEYTDGKWQGMEKDIDYETFNIINSSDEVKDKAVLSYIGYADIGSDNSYKPYLYISGFSEDESGIAPIHIISGRLPQNSGEILLPEHLAENGEVTYREGDILKLEIGDRVADTDKILDMDLDDLHYMVRENIDLIGKYTLKQDIPLVAVDDESGKTVSAEKIAVREIREFTVVGIYSRPEFEDYFSPGYTALTTPDEYTEDAQYTVFYRMKDIGNIYNFMNKNGFEGRTHSELLMFSGVSRYASFYGVIYGLISVVIGLIMFGSIMLIYNAFSISVSERTKQFGLLSSIGATKKQLRKMVRFEATALSFIGIPLGILLGIVGMWITFLAIGSRFSAFSGNAYPEPMRICLSPSALIAACVIAFVTIRISAWIPSTRATRISAVEAIRQNIDIKQKKHIKTPKIVYKLFGLPGMLAHKYFKRSKKKYRSTIISLFMSIVLFISSYAFTSYLIGAAGDANETYGMDYIYYLYNSPDESGKKVDVDDLLSRIKNTEYIKNVAYNSIVSSDFRISEKFIKKETLNSESAPLFDSGTCNPQKDGFRVLDGNIFFVDDSTYKAVLNQFGLSEEKFMDKNAPLGIAIDNTLSFAKDTGRMIRTEFFDCEEFEISKFTFDKIEGYSYPYVDGDTVIYNRDDYNGQKEVPFDECSNEVTFRIGKVIEEAPFFISYCEGSVFIYPYSSIDTFFDEKSEDLNSIIYSITSKDTERGFKALESMMNDINLSTDSLYNYSEEVESRRSTIIIVKVFAYGFIVLISLIAAANVFNTITTNINLRRREFAMLRSVGMTAKGMRKMLNFECLLYGTKALLYGLPASAGVTYLIYRSINKGIDTPFMIPWKAVGISVLSVFIVVFATMMYSMRKLKKDNPIDALKNENL